MLAHPPPHPSTYSHVPTAPLQMHVHTSLIMKAHMRTHMLQCSPAPPLHTRAHTRITHTPQHPHCTRAHVHTHGPEPCPSLRSLGDLVRKMSSEFPSLICILRLKFYSQQRDKAKDFLKARIINSRVGKIYTKTSGSILLYFAFSQFMFLFI